MKTIILFILPLFLFSCVDKKLEFEDLASIKAKSDSIATVSQKTLMQNVQRAIKEGGTAYAMDFCNVNAMKLTDSLSDDFHVSIERLTDRNRNPNNGLKTEMDEDLFFCFKENPKLIDSFLAEDDNYVFYKRINMVMPACIQCHGDPKKDIEPKTLEKIKFLYADDQATSYELNDFRGMWKISVPK